LCRGHGAALVELALHAGGEVLASLRQPLTSDEAREVLFGARQYERR
jgi:hypothetical protein